MKFDNVTTVKTLSRRFPQEFQINAIVLHFTAGGHLAHDVLPLPNIFCFVLHISTWDNNSVFNVATGSLFLNSVFGLYYS
jgi:hypothetical protein